MADFYDNIVRLAQGSNLLRIWPNKLAQIFAAGTSSLVWEGTSDASGIISVSTLPTGKYDVKVDGVLIRTIHHVTADHTHKPDELWRVFFTGAISADLEEANSRPAFSTDVAAKIIKVNVVAQKVTNAGDCTVHILKGAKEGASALTLAASIYSQRIYVGGSLTKYRVPYVSRSPLSLAANDTVAVGIDYVVAGVEGVNVELIVRPD